MKRAQQKPPIRRVLSFILPGVVCLALTWLQIVPGSIVTAAPAQFDLNSPDAVPISVFPDAISGFELYQSGVFWWDTIGPIGCPDGEFSNEANIKLRGTLSASTKIMENQRCPLLQDATSNVVRDSQYLYYFENKRLVRKAISASADTPATPLTKAPPLATLASDESLAIDDLSRLYWTTFANGTLTIWQMKADNSQAPKVFITLNAANGNVARLVVYHDLIANGGRIDGIALTENGNLWHYATGSGAPAQLIGSNIGDFWVHLSSGLLGATVVRFYAAQGGSLVRLTPSGTNTTFYPAKPAPDSTHSFGIDSVTVDDVNIYISEGLYSCPPGGFCSPDPVSRAIYRRAFGGATNAPWDLIVAQGGGTNLRSDGQFLYFIADYVNGANHGSAVKKVPTDTPPVQIDIEALDLEVTQALQDMNESFDLVAGHPTVVRGYAHLATSTDGASYQINATLTGKLNGQPLPGGPLYPLKSVIIDQLKSKEVMRTDTKLTFIFVLPESWVKNTSSALTLAMTVNPTGNHPPENVGANPLANNTVTATAHIGRGATPCLIMMPVRADDMPSVGAEPPGMAQKVARARSLLPVSDFRVFGYKTTLRKNGGDYDMDKDNTDPLDDDDDGARTDLNALDALLSLSWQNRCTSIHWVGLLHPDDPVWFGGVANGNDNVLVAKLSGVTLAHELGHNFGRRHINCGNFPAGQDNFDPTPYDPCHLYYTDQILENTYYGLDFFDLNNVTAKQPQLYSDIMSYSNPHWPSFVYWQTLQNTIPDFHQGLPLAGLAASEQNALSTMVTASAVLYVNGTLNFDADTAAFGTVYKLSADVAPVSKVTQSLQEQQAAFVTSSATATSGTMAHDTGNAVIRQLDANNVVLSETAAITKEFSLHSGGQHRYSFSQYMAFNPQTAKVQLLAEGRIIAERAASANPPTLTLASPLLDDAAGTVTLGWSASDSDGDALHAMILYSNDDGATWLPLDKNVRGLEATFSTQSLAGGTNARLRLIVDDGFNTAVATSTPFTVAKHAPTPVIDGVIEGERLPYTATTTLYGLALDVDEGSLGSAQVTWSLSGPSSRVYSGTQVILAGLAPGAYSMSLSAIDSDGMTATATKHFEILPMPIPDSKAPKLDGACSDAIYVNAVVVPLDRQGAQASLLHNGNTLYVCFSGLTLGPGSVVNVAGLRVDANNSRDSVAQQDDRGFFVDEENIPFQTVGNGSDMPVTLAPALGYTAMTIANNNSWSAEMSIADELIGGWGHAAGILFQSNVVDPADSTHNWPGGVYNQPSTWAAALFGAAPVLENRAPVANAGSDQSYTLDTPAIIALDSSASYDADLDALTPNWSQMAGPSVTLTNPTTNTIRFTGNPVSEPTLLRFQLTVSDGRALSSPDEVQITLLPAKPIIIVDPASTLYLPLVLR